MDEETQFTSLPLSGVATNPKTTIQGLDQLRKKLLGRVGTS